MMPVSRLEASETALAGVQAEIESFRQRFPERNEELDSLKAGLSLVEADLGEQREALAVARREIIELMPDPVEFAYLKVAKAEVSDLRNLVTNHIDEDHKRRALLSSRQSLRLAYAALVFSAIGNIVALVALLKK